MTNPKFIYDPDNTRMTELQQMLQFIYEQIEPENPTEHAIRQNILDEFVKEHARSMEGANLPSDAILSHMECTYKSDYAVLGLDKNPLNPNSKLRHEDGVLFLIKYNLMPK